MPIKFVLQSTDYKSVVAYRKFSGTCGWSPNQVAVWATELGFADPCKMDIDSTIQEANIAYPSDSHLMVKMTFSVNKVWMYMKKSISFFADFIPSADVKAVKAKARAYWFDNRKDAEKKKAAFEELWYESFTQIHNVKKYVDVLLDDDIERMPWNIRRASDQVNEYCSTSFLHVACFIYRGAMVPEKVLSFHAKATSCFNKGKLGKGLQLEIRAYW
jgi:transposase, IS5 family